jgi:XTP/dITP diphosphohydrolase
MKTLLVATGNQGKVKELSTLLGQLDFSVLSLADIEDKFEIVEDASTFEGNAIKKATVACRNTKLPTLADDSGLEVDFLGGEPGVYSARYGGNDLDDRGRYELLLENLKHAPLEKRTARFRAVLAYLAGPDAKPQIFSGVLEGTIAREAAGTHGFGYDPVFVPRGYAECLALLGPEIKNRISHRAVALHQFIDWLRREG